MAAKETQWAVGGGGATTALPTITKKQQSTNEQWQRRMTMTAGKNYGTVVEVVEERLFGGQRC